MLQRNVVAVLLSAVLFAGAGVSAYAHEYDRNDSDCPMRYAAYLLHPVGVALEWTVTRPFHWLVMQPGFCYVFGHEPVPGKGVKVRRADSSSCPSAPKAEEPAAAPKQEARVPGKDVGEARA